MTGYLLAVRYLLTDRIAAGAGALWCAEGVRQSD
jgi:hypothetical protein